jgi:hypothetical protein
MKAQSAAGGKIAAFFAVLSAVEGGLHAAA